MITILSKIWYRRPLSMKKIMMERHSLDPLNWIRNLSVSFNSWRYLDNTTFSKYISQIKAVTGTFPMKKLVYVKKSPSRRWQKLQTVSGNVIYAKIKLSAGARGVMFIIAGIGHGDTTSNPGLIAFHIALIPLGKVWIQLFSLQLWVNSRAD